MGKHNGVYGGSVPTSAVKSLQAENAWEMDKWRNVKPPVLKDKDVRVLAATMAHNRIKILTSDAKFANWVDWIGYPHELLKFNRP
ncbi:hypothetical protein ABZ297_15990 [Nonomuraea sp. NPDC005983]|uniref:hypothetical protein n=1 Tax=Nonomuraea sp. NPDC005983 TaxID=3155595 RepID=UPI0033A5D4A7